MKWKCLALFILFLPSFEQASIAGDASRYAVFNYKTLGNKAGYSVNGKPCILAKKGSAVSCVPQVFTGSLDEAQMIRAFVENPNAKLAEWGLDGADDVQAVVFGEQFDRHLLLAPKTDPAQNPTDTAKEIKNSPPKPQLLAFRSAELDMQKPKFFLRVPKGWNLERLKKWVQDEGMNEWTGLVEKQILKLTAPQINDPMYFRRCDKKLVRQPNAIWVSVSEVEIGSDLVATARKEHSPSVFEQMMEGISATGISLPPEFLTDPQHTKAYSDYTAAEIEEQATLENYKEVESILENLKSEHNRKKRSKEWLREGGGKACDQCSNIISRHCSDLDIDPSPQNSCLRLYESVCIDLLPSNALVQVEKCITVRISQDIKELEIDIEDAEEELAYLKSQCSTCNE
ncbi:MAG: hypothetical protein AB1540_01470 [Bdellovibrionota bacterium]